jgi:CYTH domain-containing protein
MENVESEFKFVVGGIPEEFDEKKFIEQTYFDITDLEGELVDILHLSVAEQKTLESVRLRRESGQFGRRNFLTAKGKGGFSRLEYEEKVDDVTSEKLLKKKSLGQVKKTRYIVEKGGFKFEFDDYSFPLTNLKVCEIETSQKQNLAKIELILKNEFKIHFKNVTGEKKYKNSELAKIKVE